MTVGSHCWQTTVTASPPTFHAKRHTAEEAAAMVRNGSVKANPVFGRGESAMFSAAIPESDVNHILAYNIPAISSATGANPIDDRARVANYDMGGIGGMVSRDC